MPRGATASSIWPSIYGKKVTCRNADGRRGRLELEIPNLGVTGSNPVGVANYSMTY